MLQKTVCALTLVTACTLHPAGAQSDSTSIPSDTPPEETPTTDNSIHWKVDKLRAVIEDQEAEQGAYGEVMAESLLGLGRALQQAGKHEEAVGTLNHSMHVSRVNHGIYSIQQEPALRALINSYEAQQDPVSISRAYTRLTRLYSSHYGRSAPELLPLLEEMAEWHRQTYIDNRKRDAIGYLTLSISISNTALAIAEQDPMKFANNMVSLLRGSAQSSWHVNQHLHTYKNFDPSEVTTFNADQEVRQLNKATKPAKAGKYVNQERILFNSYVIGRDAYQRIIDILHDSEAAPRDKAEVMVELGNWFNIYNRPSSARDSYQKAWHLLNDNGDQEGIEKLLGKPDSLPNFVTGHRNSGTLVEATMTIDKGGRARRVKVVRTFPENDRRAEQNAIRSIKKTRFRPRYENGQPVAYSDFTYLLRLSKKSSGKTQ
ncbi:hypothetical protein QSV34_05145 [Porticoccus sp. W117]|uniref:energy transducer TonB n=1 Tax=Porticoccus sp. W117 TaxID=3054777 RepID=UPI002598A551|nr:hypothetical protein [Porticoccus sp. W117]MDM3870734.1 hypothetical protein [Porticoccus sp. W117]